jgi:hypothetical protein
MVFGRKSDFVNTDGNRRLRVSQTRSACILRKKPLAVDYRQEMQRSNLSTLMGSLQTHVTHCVANRKKGYSHMNFTEAEKAVLYAIDSLRSDDHAPTRAEIEAIVDKNVLATLVEQLDVLFDEVDGSLVYAPYPRRGA